MGVLYTLAKTLFFQFNPSESLSYVLIVISVVSSALEVVLWNVKFWQIKSSLSKQQHPSKSPQSKPNKENSRLLSENPKGNKDRSYSSNSLSMRINGEEDPLNDLEANSQFAESDFHSVGELSDDFDLEEDEGFGTPRGSFRAPKSHLPPLEYSHEERELINRLRESFRMFPDDKIHRFMVARKFDYDRTYEMLEKHRLWRQENGVDDVTFHHSLMPIRGFEAFADSNAEENNADLANVFHHNGLSLHKLTRTGQPLMIFPIGNSDARGTANTSSKAIIERLAVEAAELFSKVLFPEAEQRTGYRVSSIAAIMDLGALGMRQFYLPALFLFTGMVVLFEENYPESLAVVCVINAPGIL